MTVVIRSADSDDEADLAQVAAIITVASPDERTSVDEMRWGDATYPGTRRFLAELDGVPVGAATVGRIYVHPPDYDAYWGTVDVLPAARGRGVGSALLREIRSAAADAGKAFLHVPASEARPEGIAFLAHRGFAEFERGKAVYIELGGRIARAPIPPDGLVLTTLAARPDLVAGVHAVALEAFQDIPGGDEPMAVGDLSEFRARDVDRPVIPAWGFVVAVDRSTDLVVGYASLILAPGVTPVGWHDMTAVLRGWRGHGLATALKEAQIAAAIEHELTLLETYNDESNAAMLAVNARLGYLPRPDVVTMRGPVDHGIMEA